ncbi:hypothetical protein A8990_10850 [Paenibacillus taihuensis]|uniref:Uncharacterized protein n=1 Tax=Paenibacillus taihuensis TaxID=1156355 RepID=A0A3D9S6F0_9BACL|nr:hypothetical protein A8990_10850 [Paenibacillus taihuensis]
MSIQRSDELLYHSKDYEGGIIFLINVTPVINDRSIFFMR